MRFRQVHLDFHTSGAIEGVGSAFSKEQFKEGLRAGHVDSITVFSKCHHGWSYHPTKVNERHPGLDFDLLGEQLEACREAGVRAEVYISAGLDEKEAVRHPEWTTRHADETIFWTPDFTRPGFHLLCFNTEYLHLLLKQIEEVMVLYHPEAIFLDICSVHPCHCASCRQQMLQNGLDPADPADAMKQAEAVYVRYCQAVRTAIDKYDPKTAVFHNAGHISRGKRQLADFDTHLELESLPTGGWGYDHFPLSASYVRTLGKEYLGMTGKFHKSWGEFGGFKHPNALRYETALSAAFGAASSIGDQLHPCGEMDMTTYRLIGAAYADLEQKESWCRNSVPVVDIALLSGESVKSGVADQSHSSLSDMGANRILLEGKYLYNVIDTEEDFSKYKLLVLPDSIRLDKALQAKLSAYLAGGGKLLASGESGLWAERDEFALDLGIQYLGRSEYKPDYLETTDLLATNNGIMVMYAQGHLFALVGATKLADRQEPYFNREVSHFCSHQHTPNNRLKAGPGAAITTSAAYIGWNIFEDYADKGSLHLKELAIALIEKLIGEQKTLKVNLPDRGVVTLMQQPAENRLIAHLLFAHTSHRGKDTEVIEDLIPFYNTALSIRMPKKPKRCTLAPQGTEIDFEYTNGIFSCKIEKFICHQMVSIEL